MMTNTALTLYALFALFGTIGGVGVLILMLRHWAVLDQPNERSSHTIPTPRGGGGAVVFVINVLWGWHAYETGDVWLGVVLAAAAGLAAVSWIDDLRSLPPLTRLAAQCLAVAAGIASLQGDGLFFQGVLPSSLDALIAAVGWIWFVNLFNFMDGIDGISGVETACVGAGAALIAFLAPNLDLPAPVYGVTIAAAALGFLIWNWNPAKVFLGDVGSVPLGFMLGWILLDMAAAGLWASALILPLYYLADATITLGKRALRGENILRAHREHFYQHAVQSGKGHAQISLTILVGNLVLMALAVAALTWPWLALGAATLTVATLLWHLRC